MLNILYNFLVMPIQLLVMFTYLVMNKLIDNKGIAIITVSLVIQTLVLPLYKRADAMQDEERARQKNMEHWVSHIKRTFKGDEKYMMLSTYYREQNYKSWYAIRSSASILLQIPFFTAAYNYLSNLYELKGVSFLFIKDLSRPDAIWSVGGFDINILPILMTVINIISGIIYTRGLKLREKVQVYGLAAVFLVLLYNSPAGLVLYWTMNNLYSLAKNVVLKLLPIPKKKADESKADSIIQKWFKAKGERLYGVYIVTALFISLFVGALFVLNVVRSSPSEFVNAVHGPMYLVFVNFALYAGIFVLWGSVFFALMKDRVKLVITCIALAFAGMSVVDYLFFGNHFGVMSPLFVYENSMTFSSLEKIVDLLIIVVLILILFYLLFKHMDRLKAVFSILAFSVLVMAIFQSFRVIGVASDYRKNEAASSDEMVNVSQSGKNVVVIMMDRAIAGFIPYIFDENPDIADMYKGFTYYPNTLSFGGNTNYGAPALFGGYEYTVEAMNARTEDKLKDKHNEALLLMPAVFSENGYNVTVCDPPYAGSYSNVSDLSIYDKYENVNAFLTVGKHLDGTDDIFVTSYQKSQESRAFYYSLMRAAPVFMHRPLYNDGTYFSDKNVGVDLHFMSNYSVLKNLSNFTEVDEGNTNNCLILQNGTTHDVSVLGLPEYEPEEGADNRIEEYKDYYQSDAFSHSDENFHLSNKRQIAHYQSNVAGLRALGVWFQFLKDNGCWDNTRIIIVSDHGYELGSFDNMQMDDEVDIERFNPLLMVKDFDSTSYSVSDEFMTNADVPSLAFEGVIENAINPFTGMKVSSDAKNNAQYVTTASRFTPDTEAYTFDTSNGSWYEVQPGCIFDFSNWKKVER